MAISPVERGATIVADVVGFSPLPAIFLIPCLLPGRPVGANLATFGWTVMAGGVTNARLIFGGTDFKKSLEMVSGLCALGLLALFSGGRTLGSLYRAIEYGSGGYLVSAFGNGILTFVEFSTLGTAFWCGAGSMAFGTVVAATQD